MNDAWQYDLVAMSIYLAREAGKVIRKVKDDGFASTITNKAEHGQHFSDDQKKEWELMQGSDFLTKADTDAQSLIVTGYRKVFPWLHIVAEEEDQPEYPNMPDLSAGAFRSIVDEVMQIMKPGEPWENWERDEMCVWIDPVDGTKEFVLGRYENCTTLLGITYKKDAVVGIVHEIFCRNTDESLGVMNWGVVGSTYSVPGYMLRDRDQDLVFSCSKPTKVVKKILQHYSSKDDLYIGGRGKQLLLILKGKLSAVVADVTGGTACSKWDICACTALLQSCGLDLVKIKDGQPYQFEPFVGKATTDELVLFYKNHQPFLSASSKEFLKELLDVCQQAVLESGVDLNEVRPF